jgi:hypothetical protein
MRPGREPVTIQLNRLALATRTGMLRIPGDNEGTIYLYRGEVTSAECPGTPDVASRLANWPAGPGSSGPTELERAWVGREAIADAALAMLGPSPRSARFIAGGVRRPEDAGTMGVAEMLAEVDRRRETIRQLPASFTADTTVARNPHSSARRLHVSASQWALLVRMNDPATPRALAMARGMSVFTTTLEVFRLIVIDLVTIVDGEPPDGRDISFLQATPHSTTSTGRRRR